MEVMQRSLTSAVTGG